MQRRRLRLAADGQPPQGLSPEGGLFLAMFQVPNKFYKADAETDMLDQNWDTAWGATASYKAIRG